MSDSIATTFAKEMAKIHEEQKNTPVVEEEPKEEEPKAEEENVKETEKPKEEEPKDKEETSKEEAHSECPSESEDNTCADEDCKCHSTEDSDQEEAEKIRLVPVRIQTEFKYFPPEINALAMIVLLLHLLNALFQLTDKNQIQCFKRPY